jgi:chromosome partitioning protein
LPSDRGLAVAETHLQGVFAKEFVLKRILEQVQDFDLCLIDCQPQCNTITKNALVAADGVLIPTQGKVFSVDGIGELEEAMEEVSAGNPTLHVEGILFNMTDRTRACQWHESNTREQYGSLVFRTVIPSRAEAEAAACERVSLVNRKGSFLGELWKQAAQELLERVNLGKEEL